MRYTTEDYTTKHEVEVEITANSKCETRREECHGYHYFEDCVTKYVINSVKLQIGEHTIDITNRLTLEEIELLEQFEDC
jgi:hypothetical protein